PFHGEAHRATRSRARLLTTFRYRRHSLTLTYTRYRLPHHTLVVSCGPLILVAPQCHYCYRYQPLPSRIRVVA
ncbi:hypothetical protein BJ546DRAFT_1079976, partial [Cryomyces antarcticus]